MNQDLITVLTLMVTVPVSIGYYKKVMAGNSKQDKLIKRAKQKGSVATGVCVKTEYLLGDRDASSLEERSPTMEVTYEYTVHGVQYYRRIHFQSQASRRIHYPAQITIYYDPDNPRKAITAEEFPAAARRTKGCLGAAVIWLILSIILANGLKLLLG